MHGYFTLPVYSDRPLFYSVQTLSSGRSYCTRFITVRQPVETCSFPFESASCKRNLGKICFASMCSFKKDEEAPTKHQIKAGLKETYGNIIKDDPAEHRNAPKIDTPWLVHILRLLSHICEPPLIEDKSRWCTNMESNSHLTPDDFHGLDVKKVEMSSYNNSKPPEEWRQLQYYKPVGRIPSDLPNLHACAHLFASDRNSLFIISNAGGFGDQIGAMGSLSHAVVFHVNSQDLMFEEDKWLCQEAWTPRSEGGRGMHESRIWNSDEVLIASTWQDGLVRKAGGESKVAVWMGGKGEKSKRVDGSHEVLKANQSKL